MQTYFVNTGSSAGGDGTTNATVGATRAFVSLDEALTTLAGSYTAESTSTVTIYGKSFTNVALQIVLDMGSTRADDTAGADLTGFTLDATHWMLIRAADGTTIAGQSTNDSRHKGVPGAGYRINTAEFTFTGELTITDSFTYHVDYEVRASSSGSSRRGIRIESNNHWLVNMIAESQDSSAIQYANDCYLINCIAKSGSSFAAERIIDASNSRFYNCGFYTGTGATTVDANFAEPTPKNCWALGGTVDWDSDFSTTGTNNASGDSSASGTSPQTGLVETAGTDITDVANGDYTVASSGKLDGNGTDLSADGDFAFDWDIAGNTRSTWSIGPFDAAAGGSSIIALAKYHYQHNTGSGL